MVDDEFNCDLDEKEFSQTKGSKFNELKSEQPMDEILPSGFTSATWYQDASRMDNLFRKEIPNKHESVCHARHGFEMDGSA